MGCHDVFMTFSFEIIYSFHQGVCGNSKRSWERIISDQEISVFTESVRNSFIQSAQDMCSYSERTFIQRVFDTLQNRRFSESKGIWEKDH